MADLREKINAELANIELILKEIADIKQKTNLTKHEINSLALYIHNFYNGVENILKQLFKNYNIPFPKSENWHKELLIIAESEKFISKITHKSLLQYVGFRHFVVHNYAFKIDPELITPLISKIEDIYLKFKKKILLNI